MPKPKNGESNLNNPHLADYKIESGLRHPSKITHTISIEKKCAEYRLQDIKIVSRNRRSLANKVFAAEEPKLTRPVPAYLDVAEALRTEGSCFTFPSPLLETPDCWIVHGFNEDLNVAMRDASLDMLTLLNEHQGLSKNDAYSLMSIAADFAVTQVVDGRQGIHVRIPRTIFPPED